MDNPPLKIGRRYLVPDKDGNEVEGTLVSAEMLENEQQVYGVYRLADGRQIIVTAPVTDAELQAYRNDPEGFFLEQQ